MPVKVVEWELPYTAWPWINIDANKVISLLLREENNLIYINDNDEAYVDLQFASWLTPNSDFPVWVTTGKVLQADWWPKSWLVLNRKTTSGDYARWIYAADWTLYLDPGTWTWKQVYYSSDIDAMLAAINARIDNIEGAWVVWIEITAIANGVATATITYWELVRWCVLDMYLGSGVSPALITSVTIDWEEYSVRPELTARQYMTWIYNIYEDDVGCFFMFDWDSSTQVQADWDEADSSDPSYIRNKPTLATVATSGDYDDLQNKPTIPAAQIQSDWDEANSAAVSYIQNKPTIPSVIDSVQSTSTTDALSANQGKELQDQINDLAALGRFLSLWDATTGQPISFPLSTPYTYSTWDYFLVETVSTASTPVNYRPSGSSYTWAASTTLETEDLEVWDLYIYDWTTWLLQLNHGKTVAFANIAWQPSDNTNLASALNWKQDTLVSWTNIKTVNSNSLLWSGDVSINAVPSGGSTGNVLTKTSTGYAWSSPASQVSDTAYANSWDWVTSTAPSKNAVYDKISAMDTTIGSKANDSEVVKLTGNQTVAWTKTFSTSPVVPSKTSDATNTGTAIATEAQVYKKQDTLVSGTSIKTINSTSLLWSGDIAIAEFKATSWWVKIFDMPSVNGSMDAIIQWFTGGWDVILREITGWVEYYYLISNWDWTNRTMAVKNITGTTITTKWISYTSGWICDNITTTTEYTFAPSNAGSTGNVLTKTAGGYEWAAGWGWGWDVQVSSQANNILTSWMKIWAGTEANYTSLTKDSNTLYLTI